MLNKIAIQKELNKGISVENGENNLGENCIYLTLGNTLKVYEEKSILDVKKENATKTLTIPDEGLVLEPGKLYLGRSNEYTKFDGFVPLLVGLDEFAALGIEIHITAGFGDNGFNGTWTLEITCTNKTIIYPNMIIGKLYNIPVIGDDSIKYRGKYFGQIEETASRINQEYTKKLVRGKNNAN